MQNELLSLIPEYLPFGMFVYDKEGFMTYANNNALEMFGITVDDMNGLNIFEDPNITPEEKAQLKRGLNISFETDYDFDRCRKEFAKGSIIEERKYFITKVTIMHDATGILEGFLLTCEDITEKKAQEQKVIDSYQKIKTTQKELSLALNAGHLTSWNYKIDTGMFYKVGDQFEVCEEWPFDVIYARIHPDDKGRFLSLFDALNYKHGLLDNNIVLRVLDPAQTDYRYYNFIYSVYGNDKDTITEITFIQHDINDDIEYQQNLILAKNKAEEADKLKSTFLATMSHEIRTPLNAIVGFSQLLAETEEATEKSEYKQLIETNSEILLKLIDDILDLSKIEAGSIDIHRQKIDLSQVCQELYQSFKPRMKNPNVTLRFINPYEKCTANLDVHRFIQVFTNFITNAIKYTAKGEIVMGYECAPGRVKIYVKDSGIGIPDDKKRKIFSRFEKLDNFAQGTGLGLSICKAIADATDGKIGFESQANKGSEFWYIGYTDVEFIEHARSSEVDMSTDIATEELAILSTNIQDLKILVAEDNDDNFLLIQNILKKNLLTRAVTGVEAVEKAKGQRFDAIFMDIKMPIMNGLEATALIRKYDKATPIIAITANAFHSDEEAALAAGCNYFMTKPIKKRELIELLSKLWIIVQQ
ncbi:MAG: response regulator [Alistipes sp.]